MEGGANMNWFAGREEGQASGMAGRVSEGAAATMARWWGVSGFEERACWRAVLDSRRRAWRRRWAICRAERILLLPDHSQACLSARLRFCLSRSL